MTNTSENAETAEKAAKEALRVAIVGYGLGGKVFHTPLVRATPGLRVAAIVTRSDEKKLQANTDLPSADVIRSFDELIERARDFDLAIITTPNKDHAPQAIAAMRAGMNVVVDKPVATNSAECQEMIKVSTETGALLSVFQNRRWDADFLTIKKLIDNGSLGQITRFESRMERYRPVPKPNAWRESATGEDGGGLLFDLGSHIIDQANFLFGKPESVYAELDIRRPGIKSDDDVFVSLTYPGGIRAQFWTSLVSAAPGARFRVLGSLGTYEKQGVDPQEEALRAGKIPIAGTGADENWGKEAPELWGKLTSYQSGLRFEGRVESMAGCHQKYYELMRDAINGKGPVPVRPEDALLTMQIIETARASSQRRSPLAMSHN